MNRRKASSETRRAQMRLEFLEARHMMAGDYNPAAAFEIQAQLDIFINGQLQVLPTAFGKNTGDDSGTITGTSSATPNRVNIKYAAGDRASDEFVTVAEILDHWKRDTVVGNPKATFTSGRILGNLVDDTHTIRFYVNGVENSEFQRYEIKDEDNIVISYETKTTDDAPTMLPIQTLSVLAGSPLYIPLNGFDSDGQALTFTATSSNSQVTTYIPQGNSTWKLEIADYGDMYFQLFDDKVPRVTEQIETLTNLIDPDTGDGFYDGLIFHRVINNFVIQGGDPDGNGTGSSDLPDFDDQYNVDLQHNRTGLLSFAKSNDDTNNSQFFITEGAQRALDFNHSIFGLLMRGENVRQLISDTATATNGTDRPLTPVVISKASIVTDTQDNVMMIKAPEGYTGTTNITVMVRDTSGKTFQQTFVVNVTPDTLNTAPFLNDIPERSIPADQTSTFTLTSQDAENDAVTYSLTKVGTVTNYSASINPTSGVVTITPPTGYTGPLTLQAQVISSATTIGNDNGRDSQTFTVNVTESRSLTIDLATESDTGNLNNDDVTNATTVNINISGVQSGDIVRLYDGNTQILQQTATGTSMTFAVNSPTEGVHGYQARFVSGGTETSHSPTLSVLVDRTAAGQFLTTPPTVATATETFTYDVEHSEEASGAISYQLQNAPTGMTIDLNTGEISWTPTAAQAGSVTFNVLAVDAAGNSSSQEIALTVNPFVDAVVETRILFMDEDGNIITSVKEGQNFFMVVSGHDVRNPAFAITLFGMDISYDSNRAEAVGSVVVDNAYQLLDTPTYSAGSIVNIGGLSFSAPDNSQFHEYFRQEFKATSSGPLFFESTAPTNTQLGFSTSDIPEVMNPLAVRFGSATLNIEPPFEAVDDDLSVAEDTSNQILSVLANDTATDLTISAVGESANGATITISSDGKSLLYTPAHDYFGTDTFTYTARNSNGSTSTATVTVRVTNVNDPPTGTNDSYNAQSGKVVTLDVLSNDSFAPDTGETLSILSVGTPSNGGTVTIVNNGSRINYTSAANFQGTETFTYTLSDGNGGTSTATVTMNVSTSATNPVANNDSLSVQEDSTNVDINVLSNDTIIPGSSTTLTISSVGATSNGGTVTISADKSKLIYTPKANYQGTETFTYTISDGAGGTATATVSVNVVNTNDPPTAKADSVTTYKNSSAVSFDLLANDSSDPDPTENLIISAVGTGSKGGTITIAADGKSVLYTPPADFVGKETFTYTIQDPGGLTATATVTVDVVNFIPSTLKGYVYIDGNRNGRHDTGEMPLANVLITLTGTNDTGEAVSLTAHTGVDGQYEFKDLAPGTYTIKETQPAFLTDGADRAGSLGSTSVKNDEMTIRVGQNANGVNYNFGELGTQTQYIRVFDLFAKRPRDVFVAALSAGQSSSWSQAVGNGWQQYASQTVSLNSAGTQVEIRVTDQASNEYTATVPLSDPRIQTVAQANGMFFVRLSAPSAFGFTATGNSGGGNNSNNVAPQLTTTASTIDYTEGATLVIDNGILVSDTDSVNLEGATVSITTNFTAGEDYLLFDDQLGITGSYRGATGVLTLTGNATLASYQKALRSIRYRNTSNNPNIAGRTITFRVNDGNSTNNLSNAATRSVSINPVNDAPKVTVSSGDTTYNIGSSGAIIDANISISDPDDTVISSATVKITSGLQVDNDRLAFTSQAGITGVYTASTGTLSFTGNSSLATYQTLLRSVTYSNLSTSPDTTNRIISFTISDDTPLASAAVTRVVKFGASNTFTISEATAAGTAIGTVIPTQSVSGTAVYELNNPSQNALLNLRTDDHFVGSNMAAPLVLIEYVDYQCPVCKTYDTILNQILPDFGNDILIVRRHFPLSVHVNADEAALAVEAAGNQGKFNEYGDLLFEKQDDWKGLSGTALTDAFASYATQLGLNVTQFNTDYAAQATLARVNRDLTDITTLGGTGTPTFYANGVKLTNPSSGTAADFKALLQTQLNGVTSPVQINRATGQLIVTKPSALNATTTPSIPLIVNVTDSSKTQAVNVTINVTPSNTAPVVSTSAGSLSYVSAATALEIDTGLTITDNSTQLAGATVKITSGYNAGHDVLSFTDQNGIHGSFDSATGMLTLTGTATLAQYQTALQSVKFGNDVYSTTASSRTIEFVVNDGNALNNTSVAKTRTISVLATNTFFVSEAAEAGTSVGQIVSGESTTGTVVYQIDDPSANDLLDINVDDHLIGNPAAPVVLIDYVDYQCPVCKTFHPIVKAMQDAFGDNLLIVRRHIPLSVHVNADEAGRAVEAAGQQGKYDEYGDLLFEKQDDWKGLSGTDLTDAFASYATQLGLNVTQFNTAYNSQAVIDRVTRDYTEVITDLGNSSAPTFYLNNTKLTNANVASNTDFQAAIQAALNAVTSPVQVNRLTGEIVVTNPSLLNATSTPKIMLNVNVTDSDNVHSEAVVVNVTAAAAAPVVTTTGGDTTYTEDAAPIAIDSGLTVSDANASPLASAMVVINGYVSGEDVLHFETQNGISGSFDAGTGKLMLTGSASVSQYQIALRSVTYSNSSNTPTTTSRSISFTASDGGLTSAVATKTIKVVAVNDAPQVTITATAASYTENAEGVAIAPNLVITDVDSTNLIGAVINFSAGFATGEDTLLFTDQNGITGTFTSSTGELVLTGNATVTEYQAALRSIQYKNLSDDPNTDARTVSIIVNDGSATNNLSVMASRSINVTATNDAPVFTVPTSQTTPANVPVVFSTANGNAISLADPDAGDGDLEVTLTATNGTIDLGDTTDLTFTGSGDGIDDTTVSFRGTLTAIQAALSGLTFNPTTDFNGQGGLQLAVNDLGNTGGAATNDSANIIVTVQQISGEGPATDSFFASLGSDDSSSSDQDSNLSNDEFTSAVDDMYDSLGS